MRLEPCPHGEWQANPSHINIMAKKKIRIGIGLFVVLMAVGYPFFKMNWAEAQVHKFCSEINIGDPVKGLKAKAEKFGLKLRDRPSYKKDKKVYPAKVLVWEGWAYARYFCDIEHDGKSVIASKETFLD